MIVRMFPSLHNVEFFAAGVLLAPSWRGLVLLGRLARVAALIRRVRGQPGPMEVPTFAACPVAGCGLSRGHLCPCDGGATDPGRMRRL
jgi:hypothetical protein